jgi:hypothetical protein
MHYFNHFEDFNPDDGTRGVTKPVGRDFVHLLCIYSSACKVGFCKLKLPDVQRAWSYRRVRPATYRLNIFFPYSLNAVTAFFCF